MDAQEKEPSADEARRTRWNTDHLIDALDKLPSGSAIQVAVPDAYLPNFYNNQIITKIYRAIYTPGGTQGARCLKPARAVTIQTDMAPGEYIRIKNGKEEIYSYEPSAMTATDVLRQLKRMTGEQPTATRAHWPITVNACDEPNGSVGIELYLDGLVVETNQAGTVVTLTTEHQPWPFALEYCPPIPDPARPKRPQ